MQASVVQCISSMSSLYAKKPKRYKNDNKYMRAKEINIYDFESDSNLDSCWDESFCRWIGKYHSKCCLSLFRHQKLCQIKTIRLHMSLSVAQRIHTEQIVDSKASFSTRWIDECYVFPLSIQLTAYCSQWMYVYVCVWTAFVDIILVEHSASKRMLR